MHEKCPAMCCFPVGFVTDISRSGNKDRRMKMSIAHSGIGTHLNLSYLKSFSFVKKLEKQGLESRWLQF